MTNLTMTAPWMRAGALIRGQVRSIFAEVERNGGTARYYENKGFIESVFSDIRLEGREPLIRWAHSSLMSLCD